MSDWLGVSELFVRMPSCEYARSRTSKRLSSSREYADDVREMPTTTQRTSPSQPARVRISAGYRKFPSACQGRCGVHSTPQRVDERRLEVLEQLRRSIGGHATEEALHEEPVQRADDEAGVELGTDRRADAALL